jgi:hypothetical protein
MNMILNFPKIHPEARRPLVDWDLILVMEPLTMAGAVRYCWFTALVLTHVYTGHWCINRETIT